MADAARRITFRSHKKYSKGVVWFALASCSIGSGQGTVTGELNIPECWTGSFDLKPDFFAAIPYGNALQIRVQRGGDYQTFSDGLSILVDNVNTILGNGTPSLLGVPLSVSLPIGVTAPGYPVIPNSNPSLVHSTLFLQESCQTQFPALFAVDAVTLDSAGNCVTNAATVPACASATYGLFDAGAPSMAVAPADGGAPNLVGRSQITFTHLFNGQPQTNNTRDKLTEASFDLYFADPSDPLRCPGATDVPLPCRGHITGSISFYFQSGRPAQPFSQ